MTALKFKKFVEETETGRKTRLSVFDFDGTIANVPEKPTSGDMRSWNGKDWWASRASLTPPDEGGFYDGGVNDEVIEAFKAAKADPRTKAILLTGRRSPAAHLVRRVLRDNGLYGRRVIDPNHPTEHDRFDKLCRAGHDELHPNENLPDAHEEYYTGDHVVTNGISGTFGHKKHVVDTLVQQNGGYEVVEIWDDRKDHLDLFKQMAKEYQTKGLVQTFIIHQVYPPQQPGQYAWVNHFTLQPNGEWKGYQ